jgi:hypothetical protein
MSNDINCRGITSKFFEHRNHQSAPMKPLSKNTIKVVRSSSSENPPLVSSKVTIFRKKSNNSEK